MSACIYVYIYVTGDSPYITEVFHLVITFPFLGSPEWTSRARLLLWWFHCWEPDDPAKGHAMGWDEGREIVDSMISYIYIYILLYIINIIHIPMISPWYIMIYHDIPIHSSIINIIQKYHPSISMSRKHPAFPVKSPMFDSKTPSPSRPGWPLGRTSALRSTKNWAQDLPTTLIVLGHVPQVYLERDSLTPIHSWWFPAGATALTGRWLPVGWWWKKWWSSMVNHQTIKTKPGFSPG